MSYTSFTSESVCAGHPDKLCDQISDAIVDAALGQDTNARLGVETAATHNHLLLKGEVTTTAKIDYEHIARTEIARLGYTRAEFGFSDQSPVTLLIGTQSPEIAQGVDLDGAGDQGMMFGFACDDTPEYMPLPIVLAHALTRAIDTARESQQLPYLRPDGKAQVTVKYVDDKPEAVTHITMAVPHDEHITLDQVKSDLYQSVVTPVLNSYGFAINPSQLIVNGTGVFHLPGPRSDAGLTGRKIVVDGYGGYARVGGGAFSGKDPTKVDRSGAYAARFIAKNIVAAGLATKAEVALAYFIGANHPVMQEIETFGTSTVSRRQLSDFAASLIDTSVRGIIEGLDLRRPIYHDTAAYGHFGRASFPWEQVKITVPCESSPKARRYA